MSENKTDVQLLIRIAIDLSLSGKTQLARYIISVSMETVRFWLNVKWLLPVNYICICRLIKSGVFPQRERESEGDHKTSSGN